MVYILPRCLFTGAEYAALRDTSEEEWEQTMTAITRSMQEGCTTVARTAPPAGEGKDSSSSSSSYSLFSPFRMPSLQEVMAVLVELQAAEVAADSIRAAVHQVDEAVR
jgi:hypothetical protein